MDPLTAFGLASNVLSFVSFASKLIKTSVEVYRSGSDHPAAALCVEQVYSDLADLNNRLILTCEHSITDEDAVPKVPVDEAKNSAIAVKGLAATCRRDCDELLRVTERLQLKHGGSSRRKWESFRIALRKLWTQKAIDDIEDRLLKTQVTLTFHICNLTASCHERQDTLRQRLQKRCLELQLDQKDGLLEVKRSLAELHEKLTEVQGAKKSNAVAISDVESLDQQIKRLSINSRLLEKEQRFLSTLQFEARPLKHDAIPQAHEQTFRWLLEKGTGKYNSHTNQENQKLAQWLESGSGIFGSQENQVLESPHL